jgi:hypothetical protein
MGGPGPGDLTGSLGRTPCAPPSTSPPPTTHPRPPRRVRRSPARSAPLRRHGIVASGRRHPPGPRASTSSVCTVPDRAALPWERRDHAAADPRRHGRRSAGGRPRRSLSGPHRGRGPGRADARTGLRDRRVRTSPRGRGRRPAHGGTPARRGRPGVLHGGRRLRRSPRGRVRRAPGSMAGGGAPPLLRRPGRRRHGGAAPLRGSGQRRCPRASTGLATDAGGGRQRPSADGRHGSPIPSRPRRGRRPPRPCRARRPHRGRRPRRLPGHGLRALAAGVDLLVRAAVVAAPAVALAVDPHVGPGDAARAASTPRPDRSASWPPARPAPTPSSTHTSPHCPSSTSSPRSVSTGSASPSRTTAAGGRRSPGVTAAADCR